MPPRGATFTNLPAELRENVISRLALRNAAAMAVSGRLGRNSAAGRVRQLAPAVSTAEIDAMARLMAQAMLDPPRVDIGDYREWAVQVAGQPHVITLTDSGRIEVTLRGNYRPLAEVRLVRKLDVPELRRTQGGVVKATVYRYGAAAFPPDATRLAVSKALDRAHDMVDAESRARGRGPVGYVKLKIVRQMVARMSTGRSPAAVPAPVTLVVKPKKKVRARASSVERDPNYDPSRHT